MLSTSTFLLQTRSLMRNAHLQNSKFCLKTKSSNNQTLKRRALHLDYYATSPALFTADAAPAILIIAK